jgi:hypothetical protein
MKYIKKPIIIEAVQWDGVHIQPVHDLGGVSETSQDFLGDDITIYTLEGKMKATKGDWIIKGVKGELYPCKPDIFEMTYEPVKTLDTKE